MKLGNVALVAAVLTATLSVASGAVSASAWKQREKFLARTRFPQCSLNRVRDLQEEARELQHQLQAKLRAAGNSPGADETQKALLANMEFLIQSNQALNAAPFTDVDSCNAKMAELEAQIKALKEQLGPVGGKFAMAAAVVFGEQEIQISLARIKDMLKQSYSSASHVSHMLNQAVHARTRLQVESKTAQTLVRLNSNILQKMNATFSINRVNTVLEQERSQFKVVNTTLKNISKTISGDDISNLQSNLTSRIEKANQTLVLKGPKTHKLLKAFSSLQKELEVNATTMVQRAAHNAVASYLAEIPEELSRQLDTQVDILQKNQDPCLVVPKYAPCLAKANATGSAPAPAGATPPAAR